MHAFVRILAFTLAAFVGTAAHAAAPPQPLSDVKAQAILTSKGPAKSLDDVRGAIVRAAAVRGWVLTEAKENSFLASIAVRKHRVTLRITFDTKAFSFSYVSSEEMNYEVIEGVPHIHPKYTQWTNNLANDIRVELAKL